MSDATVSDRFSTTNPYVGNLGCNVAIGHPEIPSIFEGWSTCRMPNREVLVVRAVVGCQHYCRRSHFANPSIFFFGCVSE